MFKYTNNGSLKTAARPLETWQKVSVRHYGGLDQLPKRLDDELNYSQSVHVTVPPGTKSCMSFCLVLARDVVRDVSDAGLIYVLSG